MVQLPSSMQIMTAQFRIEYVLYSLTAYHAHDWSWLRVRPTLRELELGSEPNQVFRR